MNSLRPDQRDTLRILARIHGMTTASAFLRHMIDEAARANADAIAKFEADTEAARTRAQARIDAVLAEIATKRAATEAA
jgi:hypothetical protein